MKVKCTFCGGYANNLFTQYKTYTLHRMDNDWVVCSDTGLPMVVDIHGKVGMIITPPNPTTGLSTYYTTFTTNTK